MKKYVIPFAFIISTLASAASFAHHSAAPFDFSKLASIEGVVKLFKVVNPHTVAVLEVTDGKKGTREIEFEGMSASVFYRAGYTRNSVKIGDRLTIKYAPRHDGEDGGFIMSFVDPAGKDIGFRTP